MIQTKNELKEYIKYERKNYELCSKYDLVYFIKKFLNFEQIVIWKYQRRLRITEYYKNTNRRIRFAFSLRSLNKLSNRYCIHIGLNVFEKGLRIVHLGPILVNGGAKVGKNCSVHINSVLAARGNSDESPELGDNIVIGVGANLIGGIKIADGIAIGANSLVNKSFLEENIAIAGVPAKKISDNGRDTWHKVTSKLGN